MNGLTTRTPAAVRQGLADVAAAHAGAGLPHRLRGHQRCGTRDGYVPHLHHHSSAWSEQPHTRIQVGLSGVGSMGCLFTLDPSVLARKPDLCFIECVVGDTGTKAPLATIGPAVEGLVRKLHSAS
jgi:hypothetical protein